MTSSGPDNAARIDTPGRDTPVRWPGEDGAGHTTPPPAEPCVLMQRYLARLELPVVDDARWDDGRVVPVTRAAVVLAHVVTLSGFTRHPPCQINPPVSGGGPHAALGLFKVCVGSFSLREMGVRHSAQR